MKHHQTLLNTMSKVDALILVLLTIFSDLLRNQSKVKNIFNIQIFSCRHVEASSMFYYVFRLDGSPLLGSDIIIFFWGGG